MRRPSLRWMSYEAIAAGLLIKPLGPQDFVVQSQFTQTLPFLWKAAELFMVQQSVYGSEDEWTRSYGWFLSDSPFTQFDIKCFTVCILEEVGSLWKVNSFMIPSYKASSINTFQEHLSRTCLTLCKFERRINRISPYGLGSNPAKMSAP